MNRRAITAFQKKVYTHYRTHGRDFPWRKTHDPYKILVSEIMLQQTQVERVTVKYQEFLKKFPSVRSLAQAPLADVLRVWQGLGYNRRARMLHECAKVITKDYRATFPKTHKELTILPGIGPYTAGAVLAFAFNIPVPIVETNIRTVFLRYFFKEKDDVSDREVLACVAMTLDERNPRAWYAALMDYGAHLKKKHGNENARSKHYIKQSKFEGSDRQIRGAIVRALSSAASTEKALSSLLQTDGDRIQMQLAALVADGLISKKGKRYQLGN